MTPFHSPPPRRSRNRTSLHLTSLPIIIITLTFLKPSHASSSRLSSTNANIVEEIRYANLPPTVFAPSGRLFNVEQRARASCDAEDRSSSLSVSLRCENESGDGFVAVVCTRPASPHTRMDDLEEEEEETLREIERSMLGQNDETNDFDSPLLIYDEDDVKAPWGLPSGPHPPFSILGPSTVTCVGGNAVDSAILLQRIKEVTVSLRLTDGINEEDGGRSSNVMTGVLARRIADSAQETTQVVGGENGRMLSSSAIIVGTDDISHTRRYRTNRIWRVDPTGQFWNCDAAAVGRGAGVAEAFILKRVLNWKRGNSTDHEEMPEDDLDNIESLVTNEDVKQYLGTLDCDEAIAVACDCIVETLKMKVTDDGSRYRGFQGAILHCRQVHDQRKKIELLNGRDIRQRSKQCTD